jgi:uncharacterized phage protein (TIGR01671 family)
MREIKFRAWNTETNCMVLPNKQFGGDLWESTYKRVVKNKNGKKAEIVSEYVSIDHILQSYVFNVMQYTGVKDINGVEIYEGDIISSDWGYSGIVDYEEFIHAKINLTISDNIQVIGNIYENPELLI